MTVAENLGEIRRRIETACARVGRDPASITLLGASKGMPPETVRQAADAGVTLFGENKVQEARAKIPGCPSRLRWHLIGRLQSNKCRDAVALFEMIQSVDSLSLAAEIHKWAEKQARTILVLLEVNVAGESSKTGFQPDELLKTIAAINAFPRLEVHGLMTIGPWTADPEKARPVFRKLRELRRQCDEIVGAPLPHLSMGMSGDFEIAIEEGATIIRLGTALFGPRPARLRADEINSDA
ncbi:MAG: dependent protein [Verrucomicrobiota bacterium]|jgi:pyridoxal phosphate enzyme (YggS family)